MRAFKNCSRCGRCYEANGIFDDGMDILIIECRELLVTGLEIENVTVLTAIKAAASEYLAALV